MTSTFYVVSDAPDRIEQHKENLALAQYETPEAAADGITGNFHGEYGTKYVLKITAEVVLTASRPWALVRKEDQS